jgi:hypothetical protein
MRLVKRLFVFASELAVVALGFASSMVFLFVTGDAFPDEIRLALFAFLVGLLVTGVGMAAIRRFSMPWKIEYDAAGWTIRQTERKLHPARARCRRIAKRVAVCVPSIISALVLIYPSQATHVLHPRSHYLRPYRIPIPWSYAVFAALGSAEESGYVAAFPSVGAGERFAMNPYWRPMDLSSEIVFESQPRDSEILVSNRDESVAVPSDATEQLRRDFRLGDTELICRQYARFEHFVHSEGQSGSRPLWWNVACQTPRGAGVRNLSARFFGRKEDIPAFYRIIEGITPVR